MIETPPYRTEACQFCGIPTIRARSWPGMGMVSVEAEPHPDGTFQLERATAPGQPPLAREYRSIRARFGKVNLRRKHHTELYHR